MKSLRISFVMCLLAACGSQGSQPTTPTPSERLGLMPLQLVEPNGAMLSMNAEGQVEVPGEGIVAQVFADGRVLSPEGAPIAALASDGRLTFEGTDVTLHVAEDGSFDNGSGQTMRWDESGAMHGNDGVSIRLVPHADNATRRTGSVLLILSMLLAPDQPQDLPPTGPPVAEPPLADSADEPPPSETAPAEAPATE